MIVFELLTDLILINAGNFLNKYLLQLPIHISALCSVLLQNLLPYSLSIRQKPARLLHSMLIHMLTMILAYSNRIYSITLLSLITLPTYLIPAKIVEILLTILDLTFHHLTSSITLCFLIFTQHQAQDIMFLILCTLTLRMKTLYRAIKFADSTYGKTSLIFSGRPLTESILLPPPLDEPRPNLNHCEALVFATQDQPNRPTQRIPLLRLVLSASCCLWKEKLGPKS